jgi:ATP-dependent DNA helicase RecQ
MPKYISAEYFLCDYDDDMLVVSMDKFLQSQTNTDLNKQISYDNYVLPQQLSLLNKKDEILWRGFLTSFGYSTFKPFQLTAIQAIQEGCDVIVIQRTGSGESICFQIPALIDDNKMSIIICPTISLIHSQVAGLQQKGIDAIAFGQCAGENTEINNDRVLGLDEAGTPSLAYTTPEHFSKVMTLLESRKENIKIIVIDEVHKVFDRQTCFREVYNSLENVKKQFPGIPIMALTDTLGNASINKLCKDYLNLPVLIKASVNRKNIKLNIGNYQAQRKNKKANNGDGMIETWDSLSDSLIRRIGDSYAIVFMDFANEVKDFSSCLKKKSDIEIMSFYGKGMTKTEKAKVVQDFNNQKFQVLCATESYKVGVHNPHVDFVVRIGCMRNMNVLLQEFGRAGRGEENSAVGQLLVNEHKDDQRLGYWLKGCDTADRNRITNDYMACWKWIYSIYVGNCLCDGILKYYEEDVICPMVETDDCCSSCELDLEKDFDIQHALILLLKTINELEDVDEKKTKECQQQR